MKEMTQGWLDIQCRTIDGVSCAILLLMDTDSGTFTPVAQCPVTTQEPTELIPIARMALAQRRPAINAGIRGNSAQQMGKFGREPARESIVFLRKT